MIEKDQRTIHHNNSRNKIQDSSPIKDSNKLHPETVINFDLVGYKDIKISIESQANKRKSDEHFVHRKLHDGTVRNKILSEKI